MYQKTVLPLLIRPSMEIGFNYILWIIMHFTCVIIWNKEWCFTVKITLLFWKCVLSAVSLLIFLFHAVKTVKRVLEKWRREGLRVELFKQSRVKVQQLGLLWRSGNMNETLPETDSGCCGSSAPCRLLWPAASAHTSPAGDTNTFSVSNITSLAPDEVHETQTSVPDTWTGFPPAHLHVPLYFLNDAWNNQYLFQ